MKHRELCKKAESLGWEFDRQTGSHYIYHHPSASRPISIPRSSKEVAKGLDRVLIKRMEAIAE